MGKHLSDEDLINRLYELGREDSHLDECEECRARWLELLARRQRLLVTPQVPAELLAGQRRSIYQRLETERSGFGPIRFAPAVAAVSVVVLGVLLSRPVPAPQPTLAVNDAHFFTEIYSLVESTEPEAVAPIYGLFED